MNLRCLYCQTPFTLSRNEMLVALVAMNEKSMNHYDAHCPRCRRANSISRQRMELFYPNWQEASKNMPPPEPASSSQVKPATASMKTEPLPKAAKKAALKTASSKKTAASTAKPATSKRKRASKPTSAKKSVPLKPSKTAPKGVKSSTTKKKK
jgi:hypothetical protein